MTSFNLSSTEVKEIVAGLSTEEVDPQELFASLVWSVWNEPGDGFAGMLTRGLGAARALELEINRVAPQAIKSMLVDQGVSEEALSVHGDFAESLQQARARWASRRFVSMIKAAADTQRSIAGKVICPIQPHWPQSVNDLRIHTPLALWLRGNPELLSMPAVSIVGSRNATSYGEAVTSELVSALAQEGFGVISGGAYGIDAMAHRSALAISTPTVSVLAGGLDRLYPDGNKLLLERIAREGCLVSEMNPGVAPSKWRFLQRNRLIAALGLATVVVEANWRSGAINTVSHAGALNRRIGAVPGSIKSPASAGCNQLIRAYKAELISSGSELLELVGISHSPTTQSSLAGLGAFETRALDSIGFDNPTDAEILADSGLTPRELATALGALDMVGLIERKKGGWQRRQTKV